MRTLQGQDEVGRSLRNHLRKVLLIEVLALEELLVVVHAEDREVCFQAGKAIARSRSDFCVCLQRLDPEESQRAPSGILLLLPLRDKLAYILIRKWIRP